MRPALKVMAVAGALVLAGGLGIGGATARAQGYATTAPPAYYYPAAGYYNTTAGVVYIPAPGYYYDTPSYSGAPSYRSSYYSSPGYRFTAPRTVSSGSRGYSRRGEGSPNNPPFYSSGAHSLHARGWNSYEHGR